MNEIKSINKQNIIKAIKFGIKRVIQVGVAIIVAILLVALVIEVGYLIFVNKHYPFNLFKFDLATTIIILKITGFAGFVYFMICFISYFDNAPPTQYNDDDDWWWLW